MNVRNYLDVEIRNRCSFKDMKILINELTKISDKIGYGITIDFNNNNQPLTSWYQYPKDDKTK